MPQHAMSSFFASSNICAELKRVGAVVAQLVSKAVIEARSMTRRIERSGVGICEARPCVQSASQDSSSLSRVCKLARSMCLARKGQPLAANTRMQTYAYAVPVQRKPNAA